MAVLPANQLLVYSGQRAIDGREVRAMVGYNPDVFTDEFANSMPIGLGLTFAFLEVELEASGFPKDEARNKAFDRRDGIIKLSGRFALNGMHAGDVFWPAKVRHQFQLTNDHDVHAFRRVVTDKFGANQMDLEPDWSFASKVIRPNPIEREYAENRDTLSRIEASGVEPRSVRLVDFQFVGSLGALKKLSSTLSKQGFATKMLDGELVAERKVSLDWWPFAETCSELRREAEVASAEFVGWGCLSDE